MVVIVRSLVPAPTATFAGSQVFGGVGLELRLAGRAAEQELSASADNPMRRVGSYSHSANRIAQFNSMSSTFVGVP